MYRSIYEFAKRRGIVPDTNYEMRKIAGYIHITPEGDFQYLETFANKDVPSKKCPKRLPGGNDAPYPIVDKAPKYVLSRRDLSGKELDEKKYNSSIKKHELYLEVMREAAEVSPSALAIYKFLEKMSDDSEARDKYLKEVEDSKNIKDSCYLSWKVDGMPVEDDATWKEWYEQKINCETKTEAERNTSLSILSGRSFEYEDGTYPLITQGPVGTGVPIFSNRHRRYSGSNCAFSSYGATSPFEAGMLSSEEAERIKAGMQYLFTTPNHNNKRFEIVYWYAGDEQPDLIGFLNQGIKKKEALDPAEAEEIWSDALRAALKDDKENPAQIYDEIDADMHVIQYEVPSKGRFLLKRETVVPYAAAAANVLQWFEDCRLECIVWLPDQQNDKTKVSVITQKEIGNIFSILRQTLSHINSTDQDIVKKEHGADVANLLYAAILNKQIPHGIYRKALHQMQRNIILGGFPDGELRSKVLLLQVIKAYLRRTGEEDNYMDVGLNKECKNPGYLCGRVLTVMDRLQKDAIGNVGQKVSQKCIRVVERNPVLGMKMVLENEENYLQKLRKSGEKGAMKAGYFKNLLNEILANFTDEFPSKLSDEEKGSVYLGMHHQDLEMMKQAKAAKEAKEKGTEDNQAKHNTDSDISNR